MAAEIASSKRRASMLRQLGWLLGGLLASSIVAAAVFHTLVASLSPGAAGSAPVALQATLATIAFQAFLVLLIGIVIGLPGFLLARRFGFANGLTATGFGLVVGLVVSAIYGDLEAGPLTTFLRSLVVFGVPGMLAGASFWLFARRSDGES